MRRAHNELEGNQEMLSDQFDGLHYGVVMLGGCTNCSDACTEATYVQCGKSQPGGSTYNGFEQLYGHSDAAKSCMRRWRWHRYGRRSWEPLMKERVKLLFKEIQNFHLDFHFQTLDRPMRCCGMNWMPAWLVRPWADSAVHHADPG